MASKNSFYLGFSSSLSAWKFIAKHNLWHFFLYPVLLSILLGMGISALLHDQIENWTHALAPMMSIEPLHTNDWKDAAVMVWNEFSSAVLRVLLWLRALLIYWKVSK